MVIPKPTPDLKSNGGKDAELFKDSEDSEDSSQRYVLPKLMSAAIACVLEQCIEELTILGNIGSLPKIQVDLGYKSLAEKYQQDMPLKQIFDPVSLKPMEQVYEEEKLSKFQRDRGYLEKILRELTDELLSTNSYGVLVRRLREYHREEEEERQLLERFQSDLQQESDLVQLIEKEQVLYRSQLQKLSEAIGRIKDEYEDLLMENETKMRYVEKWEKARQDQNVIDTQMKEKSYSSTIAETNVKMEQEMRVNTEMESYISETQKEYQEEIMHWKEKYYQDLEAYETKTQLLRQKREIQLKELQHTVALYEKRKQEMDDWIATKERMRQEELEQQKIYAAALRIQAWWRGTMVRSGLGSYGKKKKKGKKK